MITFEEGLVSVVTADPAVQRLLGDRLSGGPPRQTVDPPYGVYRLISRVNGYFIRGRNGNANLKYQLDIWDTDPDRCAAAATAVEDLLDGYRGWLGGCFVRKLKAAVVAADDEPEDDESDKCWYRRRLEVEADVKTNRPIRPPGYQDR